MKKKFVQNSVVFIHSYVYRKDPGMQGPGADYLSLGDPRTRMWHLDPPVNIKNNNIETCNEFF